MIESYAELERVQKNITFLLDLACGYPSAMESLATIMRAIDDCAKTNKMVTDLCEQLKEHWLEEEELLTGEREAKLFRQGVILGTRLLPPPESAK